MGDRYLFRAKRINTGEWIQGDLVHWRNEENTIQIVQEKFGACIDENGSLVLIEEPFVCKIDASTVCQCTGLRDKNGTLIFEGDIGKISNPGHFKDSIVTVKWEAGAFLALFENGAEYEMRRAAGLMRVIGNIHDNPELKSPN